MLRKWSIRSSCVLFNQLEISLLQSCVYFLRMYVPESSYSWSSSQINSFRAYHWSYDSSRSQEYRALLVLITVPVPEQRLPC
jgi:hypothetical protein